MNHMKIAWTMLACALAWAAAAQDTNLIRTQIGLLEARTGVLIVKGAGQVGAIPLGAEQLTVRCKETSVVNTGEKTWGLMLQLEDNQNLPLRVLVDDDEVDSLINAVDYLMKINFEVTSLPGFEASYTSKAGLRIIAHSDRREGTIHAYVQFGDYPRVPLSSVQMTQLYGLLGEARKNLAALKSGKPADVRPLTGDGSY
jgi:hypothetical protein